jgi:hypothetical protein
MFIRSVGSLHLTAMCSVLALFQPMASATAHAEVKTVGTFDEVVRDAAEEIVKITKDESISIGQFTPTLLPDSNSGPAIGELLKKAIETLKPGIIRREAAFEVKGDYELTENPEAKKLKAISITFRIISRANRERKTLELTRHVDDNTSIGRLLNVGGHVPEKGDRETRNKTLEKLSNKPQAFIDPAHPSLVSSSSNCPFAVEIMAARGSESPGPRTAKLDENGLAFVMVERGEVYEINIHNKSSEETAVQIFIDGLSVFQFSEDRFTHFIVAPGEQAIVGWHKSFKDKRFDSFLVMEYGKGASSQAGIPSTGPIGVIQVQFSKCHELLPGGRKRSTANETGFGPPRTVEQVKVEREISPPSDFVTVRYTR